MKSDLTPDIPLSPLKQAQGELAAMPEVDHRKVEAIRAAVNSGKITPSLDTLFNAIRHFHKR